MKGIFIMKFRFFNVLLVIYAVQLINASYNQDIGDTLSDCKKQVASPNCRGRLSTRSPRTLDGTCNNLRNYILGAAFTPVKRLIPAVYFDQQGLDTPRGFPGLKYPNIPTPHQVSANLFTVLDNDSGNNGLVSNLHMTYGQFLDHDMDLSPNAGGCANPKCSPPGSKTDFKYPCFPIRFSNNTEDNGCTKFIRSFAMCQKGKRTVREQVNVLSSYIDASMVYSVNKTKAKILRTNDGTGQLRITSKMLLPIDPEATDDCKTRGGCFLAGDGRVDEHIGLANFHILFAREHNRIAKEMKQINGHWSGERIYQTARKIVGAIMQHITYNEYVPTFVDLKSYRGYKKWVDPSISNAFSTAAFRFGHSQVKNSWGQLNYKFEKVAENLPLRQTFKNNTVLFNDGIERTVFGLLGNRSEEVDTKFASGVAKNLFIPPGTKGFANLAAINTQRGRDHGLPGYNEYRAFCGLRKARRFHDFRNQITSRRARIALKKLYKSVNNHIDLFPAGLAEKHVYGKLVGETFGCILGDQFERTRDGDRFYYQRRGVFTYYQLREIKKVTMSRILCDNLKGIVSIQRNAFKSFKRGDKRVVCDSIPHINLRAWRSYPYGFKY